jgi:hypothetical protein
LINKKQLYHARTGNLKIGVSKAEAIAIANKNIVSGITIKNIQLKSVDKHHEYREKMLPAYVISYQEPNNLKCMFHLMMALCKQ